MWDNFNYTIFSSFIGSIIDAARGMISNKIKINNAFIQSKTNKLIGQIQRQVDSAEYRVIDFKNRLLIYLNEIIV